MSTSRGDRLVGGMGLGGNGGAIAFGVIGIFLVPTLLAIGYTVVRDWALAEPIAATTAPGLEQG